MKICRLAWRGGGEAMPAPLPGAKLGVRQVKYLVVVHFNIWQCIWSHILAKLGVRQVKYLVIYLYLYL